MRDAGCEMRDVRVGIPKCRLLIVIEKLSKLARCRMFRRGFGWMADWRAGAQCDLGEVLAKVRGAMRR